MVSKKLPYDTNGLPYDVYMGDSRPQCSTSCVYTNITLFNRRHHAPWIKPFTREL